MRGPRAGTELRELGSRLATLALILINTAVDLLFLVLWIGLHRVMQPVFRWLGTLEGLDGLTLTVIKVTFTVSTLGVIVAFTLQDLYLALKRIRSMR
jgi:hypothetical protein